MPRMARVVLPHMPHHVVQRGPNRQAVFAGAEDCERYLEDLRELSSGLDIRVYGYCLMTNHVRLLLGHGEEVAAMGRLMKARAARARMAPAAGESAWSSFRQRMGEEDQWIDLDPAYSDLADNGSDRRARYARLVQQGVPEQELSLMREALQRGQLTGKQRFVNEVEQIIGCRIERRRLDRPRSRRR
ncbi:transposase [Thioalkalivibrio sp. AKL7]|uniref:transposase n=1 Tax=Thioalkalivibrio sp. AKL7 TaxID=1158155 RepID=UPI000476C039|nr:transposase [Thioalkalivibrio sp. AKL7]